MATFISAIAATIVATALQVGAPGRVDALACLALAMTIALTWGVVRADRLTVPDLNVLRAVLEAEEVPPGPEYLRRLRIASIAASHQNRTVVPEVKRALARQATAASSTALLAALGLLWPFLEGVLA
jgi:hypothetical protein